MTQCRSASKEQILILCTFSCVLSPHAFIVNLIDICKTCIDSVSFVITYFVQHYEIEVLVINWTMPVPTFKKNAEKNRLPSTYPVFKSCNSNQKYFSVLPIKLKLKNLPAKPFFFLPWFPERRYFFSWSNGSVLVLKSYCNICRYISILSLWYIFFLKRDLEIIDFLLLRIGFLLKF